MNVMRSGTPLRWGDYTMNPSFAVLDDDRIVPMQDADSPDQPSFSTESELADLVRDWPLKRLVGVWNQLPNVNAVQRFENRAIAVSRIWRVLDPQGPTRVPRSPRKSRRQIPLPRSGTKTADLLNLMQRPQGATLAELMSATDWQAHSVRGFISGNLVRKRGLKVVARKEKTGRVYRIK